MAEDYGAARLLRRGCAGRYIPMTTERILAQIPREWLDEFAAAARRPLSVRMRYAFIKTYKPVLDDASYRAFDTMEEYRMWCEEALPRWLGYSRQPVDSPDAADAGL